MTQHKATTTRLDIAGFKSFADEVRLDILPGLTGIVGPNGCGKSNIVEALRWTMGESSARALRGGESDDLIFAGTGNRPARNLARVTLHLGEATGLAPPPFQQAGELEISRQAERGAGSTYRINNRVMRARDVQTIFADLSSGARSSSIISQNRVSQLIAARPEERRLLLEEAAGITGLHVRRRDAELKLRQAESNLERAEEHRQTLEQQLDTLSGQSEQARRYRTTSEEIRQHERALLILQHTRAAQLVQSRQATLEKTRQTLARSEQALHTAQEQLDTRLRESQTLEADLVALRPKLEQHRIHVEVAQASLRHQQQAAEEQARQKTQLEADLARQQDELARLEARQKETRQTLAQLAEQQQALETAEPEQARSLARLREEDTQQEARHADLAARYQEGRLQQERLQSRLHGLNHQITEDRASLEGLQAELEQVTRACEEATPAPSAREALATAMQAASTQEQQARLAESRFQEARLAEERAGRDVQDAESRLAQLEQREAELAQSLARLHQRRDQDREQAGQARTGLLDENARTQLHQASQTARQQAENAAAAEQDHTARREETERLWLAEQAALEKRQQRRAFLQEEITRLDKARSEQAARLTKAQTALDEARTHALTEQALKDARQSLAALEQQHNARKDEAGQTRQSLDQLRPQLEDARTRLQETEQALLRCKGEHEGLERSLQGSLGAIPHPVLEQLHIPDHLIRAVATALTDGLEASLPPAGTDTLPETPRLWRTLPADTAPQSTDPALAALPRLDGLVTPPPALARAFAAIFLLDDPTRGPGLQARLLPGQAVVTESGALWRWDGFIRQPDSPTAEMVRLQQVQTLQKLHTRITELTRQHETCQQQESERQQESAALEQALQAQQKQLEDSAAEQARQQHRLDGLEQRHALQQEQLALLGNDVQSHQHQQAQTTQALKDAEAELVRLPPAGEDQPETASSLETLRAQEQAARKAVETARAAQQEAESRERQALFQHEALQSRLAELEQGLAGLETEIRDQGAQEEAVQGQRAQIDLASLRQQREAARKALEASRESAAHGRQQAGSARQEATRQEQAMQERARHLTGLQARQESLAQQVETGRKALAQHQADQQACKQEQAALPALDALKDALDKAATTLGQTRQTRRQQEEAHARLTQELSRLRERQAHLREDSQQQERQRDRMDDTVKELGERLAALLESATAGQASGASPRHEDQLRQDMDTLTRLEGQETRLREALKQARAGQQEQQALLDHHKESSSQHREAVIRLTERAGQAEEALALLQAETPLPEDAEAPGTVSAEAEQALRQALRRALKRREDLGPVNLCAEDEFRAARTEAERIAAEHKDLSTAIARLRGGVGAINREGRQRLMAVFADINGHFQALFTRMFNGGKAHLQMVGSEDPLEAGLEIFAQPPGKKLAALSLLSGGEQALTALSLIFAAFHCTPAPLCVLDEVDAPLDDANVERFCTLLRDMTRETGTRFLVVTHHQLTMAHMDRLYGITMQERGVSRLLSVNLDESIKMVNG